jgi:hypothetical protein
MLAYRMNLAELTYLKASATFQSTALPYPWNKSSRNPKNKSLFNPLNRLFPNPQNISLPPRNNLSLPPRNNLSLCPPGLLFRTVLLFGHPGSKQQRLYQLHQ